MISGNLEDSVIDPYCVAGGSRNGVTSIRLRPSVGKRVIRFNVPMIVNSGVVVSLVRSFGCAYFVASFTCCESSY